MKILAPVDGSAFTQRMLDYLGSHDEWKGPQHQYTLLHVVAALPSRAAAVLDHQLVKDYYAETGEAVLGAVREKMARTGLNVSVVSKVGHAADVIIDQAKQGKFDLIVLGSHGHGAVGSLVMGSVATRVIAGCTVPVLLIR